MIHQEVAPVNNFAFYKITLVTHDFTVLLHAGKKIQIQTHTSLSFPYFYTLFFPISSFSLHFLFHSLRFHPSPSSLYRPTSTHSSQRSTSGSFPPSSLSKERSPNAFLCILRWKIRTLYFTFTVQKCIILRRHGKQKYKPYISQYNVITFAREKKSLTGMLNDGLNTQPTDLR